MSKMNCILSRIYALSKMSGHYRTYSCCRQHILLTANLQVKYMSGFFYLCFHTEIFSTAFCMLLKYSFFPVSGIILLPFLGLMGAKFESGILFLLISSIAGGMLGCILLYLIGLIGGYRLINTLGNIAPSLRKKLHKASDLHDRHPGYTVLFHTKISIICGACHDNFLTYLLLTFSGMVIRHFVLTGSVTRRIFG